jgi:hypothetical protein
LIQKNYVFLIIISIFLTQITFAQPHGTVQLFGGYTFPLPDLKGEFGDSPGTLTLGPDSNTYFTKSGAVYGIEVMIPIKHHSPINIVGSLLANNIRQERLYPDTAGNFKVETSMSITTFGLGVEYNFAGKKTIFYPYAGILLTLNLFSGKFITTAGLLDPTTLTLQTTVRGGIQITGGLDYVLHNNIGITLGLKYSYANLIGKNATPDVLPTYYLNDGERTDQGVVYPARNITYLSIFGGFSFYFGR